MITNKPILRQWFRRCSGRRPFTLSFEGCRALFPVMWALIGCALCFPSPAPAQADQPQTELDVASYVSQLDRCAQSIKHPATIHQLRQSLPRNWRVRVGDQIVEVSTAWLAADLNKIVEDPARSSSLSQEVDARLIAMRKAAEGLEQRTPSVSFDAAHTQLDKILSGREFGSAQGPSQLDILKARIARWISEQIYKILRRLHLGAKAGNGLAWIIVGIAFLALSYWVWKTLRPATRKKETPAEPASESNDPREWARDALAAADRGDYREAVHCAYWAAVVHLETLGVLKRDRARTPRESLHLLDPHPAEQNLLREFTRRFELIWYGYRPASANDWSEARSHLEKMGCLTPSTPATANS
jgi:Domain of unknown function (DUF4129)